MVSKRFIVRIKDRIKPFDGSDIIAILIAISLVVLFTVLIILSSGGTKNVADLPDNLEYRAVEPTGFYGAAGYYVFDAEGRRIRVTQEVFDKLKNLERK